jgi:hypothetical protein
MWEAKERRRSSGEGGGIGGVDFVVSSADLGMEFGSLYGVVVDIAFVKIEMTKSALITDEKAEMI